MGPPVREGNRVPLANVKQEIFRPNNSEAFDYSSAVCTAVLNSCITDIWGKELGIGVRDFVGELARNEFMHGGAGEFILEIDARKVSIKSNGKAFSIRDLLSSTNGQGGQLAARFLKRFDDSLLFSYRRDNSWNIIEIALICDPEDVLTATSCSISAESLLGIPAQSMKPSDDIAIYEHCDSVYVAIPVHMHFLPSFSLSLADRLKNFKSKRVVLVGKSISPGIVEFFLRNFPNIRIMEV